MTLARQLLALRLVLTSLLVLVAGLTPAFASTGAGADGAPLQKVRVQLKWTHQFQFAGFYAAIEQGFFRNAGLDVELIEGGPLIDPVTVVAAGQAEFGVGTSSLLIDFSKGRPIMAVAAILQHSPFVILARRDPTLRTVRDLEGRTLMGESHSDELTAYLKTAGVPLDRVQIKPHSGDVTSLLGSEWDQVDAMTAYISTEPFEAARRNIPYQIFNPRDLNINFYGDTLFTSRQVALAQPHVVAAMRDALIAGWRYALAHQAEIVDLILRNYRPRMDRTELSLEAQATYNLFQNDLVDIGYMSRERWQSIGQVYAASGMLPKDFSLNGFMFSSEEAVPAWVYRALIWAGLAIVAGGLLAAYIVSLNLRLAASLRTMGAQAEKLEAANNELARLSTTDPLTGLFNRRYFDETLALELNRAGRSGGAVTMMMVDIDHFKKYNDALGHPAGDVCLKLVADVLRRNAQRAGEFAARIGGEEFAVIASKLDAAGAQALAERILRDMAALKIPHPATPLGHVTVSIGVSTLEDCTDHTPQQLISRADAALYRAKDEGRNRWATA